jgi:hypothetical protein
MRASVTPLPLTLESEGADQPFCLEMVACQAFQERRPCGAVIAQHCKAQGSASNSAK